MCGIIGYVGAKPVVPLLLDGLRRLEYRGYDSAGLAVGTAWNGLELRRAEGKLRNLEMAISAKPFLEEASYGIGHTRWATHGRPSERNAHPHPDCTGEIVVVHNGIIENYMALRRQLCREGHQFSSDTDTEVVAHLVEKYLNGADGGLETAVRRALRDLSGAYALAVISRRDPNKIVAVRLGPPALVGLGQDEYFVASDVPAVLGHTRELFFLGDGDMAVLTAHGVQLTDFEGRPIHRSVQHITWDPVMAEKGGYRHFMLKEIFEQPRSVRETTIGRVNLERGEVLLEEMGITPEEFRRCQEVKILACGTSWHAGLAVEVDYGSEFRYRDPLVGRDTLTVVISQSGETADTLAAQREAKAKGSMTVAICNVVGSMVTREAAGTILTHAGPEIGVASTKAFTSQLTALYLLAVRLGRLRGVLQKEQAGALLQELTCLPAKLEQILAQEEEYEKLARRLYRARDFLFLGRGIHYPIALEGALKLKEISYIHAEGYPAGEMKHGPNALIDENLPVVVIATCDPTSAESQVLHEKTLSNIKEVKARDGIVVAVATEGYSAELRETADYVLEVPRATELLSPILEIVPLQLLAYHIAVLRGCDVDQPRNLAKSVTVE
jgi:glucosamine--fructose-6-phosphate aminotransferase (isomerizing)